MNECNSGLPNKLVDVPEFRGETVEVVTLVPQERVQWTDEQVVTEFFDMFTSKDACLAGLHELRTQMEAAGITFCCKQFGTLSHVLAVHVFFFVQGEECFSRHLCCRCCTQKRRTGNGAAFFVCSRCLNVELRRLRLKTYGK